MSRYGVAILLALAVTLILWLLRDILTVANFSLVYILIVLATAVRQGTGPSLVVAIICFLSFNFFLVRPFYTFFVADPRELLDLLIFLLVAVITGRLAAFAHEQAETARQRASEQEVLLRLTSTFNQLSAQPEIYRVLQEVLQVDLGARSSEILPPNTSLPATSENSAYVTMKADSRTYGTLSIQFAEPPTPWQLRMVAACVGQASSALQRVELTQQAQQSQTFEEADRLKTALLHAVSHDLRTPITIIKSSISNLLSLRGKLTPGDEQEMLELVDREADELNDMVGDLLDMSRLKAGALVLNKDWNSLEEIAGDVAASIWQRTKQERIRLCFPDDMPLVRCDYGLILRALSNLVENALRYEPEHRRVEICGSFERDVVRVAVVNHGPPVAPEERSLITEPFYHGNKGHIGLGLPIAKGILEAHQGSLTVEDTLGSGATFVCTLPRIEDDGTYEHPDR